MTIRCHWTEMSAMKIKYFQDTDTPYIELRAATVAETNDVDENTCARPRRKRQGFEASPSNMRPTVYSVQLFI